MEYKGKELKEANGTDYPLSPTPKKMLVWDNGADIPEEREVFGYHNGKWLVEASLLAGVIGWCHAAEIPEEPKKKWRPFNSVDEFIKAAGGMGVIWLKCKEDSLLQLVTAVRCSGSSDPIRVYSYWTSFYHLLDQYTFADGTPCGVEEDA